MLLNRSGFTLVLCREIRVSGADVTENRSEHRKRVLWSGLIFVPQTHSTIDCAIRDLSEAGARVRVQGEIPLPIKFLFVDITNRAAYEVQCVWRNERELGVKLLRPIQLEDGYSIESIQLKRLMLERLNC